MFHCRTHSIVEVSRLQKWVQLKKSVYNMNWNDELQFWNEHVCILLNVFAVHKPTEH